MRTPSSIKIIGSVLLAVLILLGVAVQNGYSESPPVAAALVREGSFALTLAEALGVGHPSSEIEAESMLGAAGVAPRNGWIADYPVTPDIIGELRDSISYASQTKTLSMDTETALRALENVQTANNILVTPGAEDTPGAEIQMPAGDYPDQTAIDSYYSDQGPPIVTYYTPPADYYYLYSWVPYPFWWSGFSFGGYFILNDFHRHFRDHGHVRHVSNHFNDTNAHRVFRIDPIKRTSGRTFAGIGAPRSSKFISTGTKGAGRSIFNPGRSYAPPAPGKSSPRGGISGRRSAPAVNSYRSTNPFREQKVYRPAPRAEGRMSAPPVRGESRGFAPAAPAVRGDGMPRGGGGRDMRR